MHDLGGPIEKSDAVAKHKSYLTAFTLYGYSRFAVFDDTRFAGYVGVMPIRNPNHPLGRHNEIGWRIMPKFWGKSLATGAANLALTDIFDRVGLDHVLAYTSPDNLRSQAVMARLGMTRTPELDFEEHYPPVGIWQGLTWRITAEDHRAGGIE